MNSPQRRGIRESGVLGRAAVVMLCVVLLAFCALGQAELAPPAPTADGPPAPKPIPPPPPSKHAVSVTFDYDFSKNHACPPDKKEYDCVKQFNVYNLTADGGRTKLFSIPAPAGARTPMTGITGSSGQLTLASGDHMIGIGVQSSLGLESDPQKWTTMVTVAADPAKN
jgi:hypothetical protein